MLNEKDKEWLTVIIDDKIKERTKPDSKFVKWAKSWFMYLTPPSIIAGIWFYVNVAAEDKALRFDNPSDKHTVVEHVRNNPSHEEVTALFKHVYDTTGVHMPKSLKDKSYITRPEYNQKVSDLERHIYLIRKDMRTVKESQNDMHKDIKIIANQIK